VASLEVHDLIIDLRDKGVTVFLTTHRLDEAEKLCDRVAILNTTLRTVGRIDDLRQRMFHKSILVSDRGSIGGPRGTVLFDWKCRGWSTDDKAVRSRAVISDCPRRRARHCEGSRRAGADVLSLVEGHHSLEEVIWNWWELEAWWVVSESKPRSEFEP